MDWVSSISLMVTHMPEHVGDAWAICNVQTSVMAFCELLLCIVIKPVFEIWGSHCGVAKDSNFLGCYPCRSWVSTWYSITEELTLHTSHACDWSQKNMHVLLQLETFEHSFLLQRNLWNATETQIVDWCPLFIYVHIFQILNIFYSLEWEGKLMLAGV